MPMEACLAALEESFRELAEKLAVNRPYSDLYPTSEKDVYYRYKTPWKGQCGGGITGRNGLGGGANLRAGQNKRIGPRTSLEWFTRRCSS